MLAEDLDALREPSDARGVRLLPPSDAYTQMRDRETIVAKALHSEVWKTVGAPGAVLADGNIVGTWRPRKSGRTLALKVSPFQSLTAKLRGQLREEAYQVAKLRGASKTQVEFSDS